MRPLLSDTRNWKLLKYSTATWDFATLPLPPKTRPLHAPSHYASTPNASLLIHPSTPSHHASITLFILFFPQRKINPHLSTLIRAYCMLHLTIQAQTCQREKGIMLYRLFWQLCDACSVWHDFLVWAAGALHENVMQYELCRFIFFLYTWIFMKNSREAIWFV